MDHVLNHFTLVRRLYELGFLRDRSLLCAMEQPAQAVARAIWDYQEFHGLKKDGWVGPKTREHLLLPRFCGLPDVMNQGTDVCKWPQKNLSWTIGVHLSSIPANDLIDIFKAAWQCWADVCDIQPIWVPNDRTANVKIDFGAIDGTLGVLAWSELPCNPNVKQLRQLYDHTERWNKDIDLVTVAAHELGHALGLGHLPAGNLLQPSYSPTIRKPQAGDVAEVVKRYGPPQGKTPPPAEAEEYVIRFPTPVSKIVIRRAA